MIISVKNGEKLASYAFSWRFENVSIIVNLGDCKSQSNNIPVKK